MRRIALPVAAMALLAASLRWSRTGSTVGVGCSPGEQEEPSDQWR